MGGGELVLEDIPDDILAHILVQILPVILDQAAKRVAFSIGACESEPIGHHAADAE
jgi:hypothetical protein